MKNGESEAKKILEKLGIEFDNEYCDDNSGKSMPDLRYKNGRYLEITHTKHNNSLFKPVGRFWKKPIEEQLKISHRVSEALTRFKNLNYERIDGRLTESGLKQYRSDCRLMKDHLGYDPTSFNNPFSEFKCDIPMIYFSADNILDEITKDKGEKYPNGDTDLFVFVTEEEFDFLFQLLSESSWNGTAIEFIKSILKSPFPVIYICIWNIRKQEYEIDNPVIKKLENDGVRVVALEY